MHIIDVVDRYEISSKTIYMWLCASVVDGIRNNRLKAGVSLLYRILGRATTKDAAPKILAILDKVDSGWRKYFVSHHEYLSHQLLHYYIGYECNI